MAKNLLGNGKIVPDVEKVSTCQIIKTEERAVNVVIPNLFNKFSFFLF